MLQRVSRNPKRRVLSSVLILLLIYLRIHQSKVSCTSADTLTEYRRGKCTTSKLFTQSKAKREYKKRPMILLSTLPTDIRLAGEKRKRP